MSESVLQDLVVRMATDPAFAEQVRTAPEATLSQFALSPEEMAQLSSLGADAAGGSSGLETRQSKSSLLFMGGHHVPHDPGLAHTGHVPLHDAGSIHHGPGGGGGDHSDPGDQPLMITDTKEGGFGQHGGGSGVDDPESIMLGTIKFGGGENVELHGGGPIE